METQADAINIGGVAESNLVEEIYTMSDDCEQMADMLDRFERLQPRLNSSPHAQDTDSDSSVGSFSFWSLPVLPWTAPMLVDRTAPLRICLEGSIGSGKSSVVQALMGILDAHEWMTIPEPVEGFAHLLEPFYEAKTAKAKE